MQTVTALRPERGDRMRVELDGTPWRTLPVVAVAAAGLRVGGVLSREKARDLARSLRRTKAARQAASALMIRDRSPAGLDAELKRRGIAAPADRAEVVAAFGRLGYLDAQRFAVDRATSLAKRGYGNDAIRFDLEREGVEAELLATAVEGLEPELVRARAVLASAGGGPKAFRRLAAKGFSADSVEALAEGETFYDPSE